MLSERKRFNWTARGFDERKEKTKKYKTMRERGDRKVSQINDRVKT